MKLFFLFFLFLHTLPFISSQLCTDEEQCKLISKKLIYIPEINELGELLPPSHQVLDYKLIKVFKNCLAIYSMKNLPSEVSPSQKLATSDLIRRIPYSKIYLDCGEDGNKLCLAGKFIEIYSNVSFWQNSIDSLMKLNVEFNRNCIIIPIIDALETDLSKNLMYVCEDQSDKMREFFKFRDELSRLISSYNFDKTYDFQNSQNSLAIKQDYMKTFDSDNNLATVYTVLNSGYLSVYSEKNRFNSLLFKINLMDLNFTVSVMGVSDAIAKGYLNDSWSGNYTPKPIDSCCFMISIDSRNNM